MRTFQRYKLDKYTIYQIKIKTLPNLINNVYAIIEEDGITLIDAGYGKKTAAILNKAIRKISLMHHKELKRIIITHSHIDHFGAINRIKGTFIAYAHVPDADTIKNFKNSLSNQENKLKRFLRNSKTPLLTSIMIKVMYKMHKAMFNGHDIKQVKEGNLGNLRIILTPGHSPGHICIGLGKAIFTGDHILPTITPTQSPEYLTHGCGLENYFKSLKKVDKMNFKMAFPGHEEPFVTIKGRIKETIKHHEKRLENIRLNCHGKTLYQTAKSVFGKKMKGYHNFLGLLEAAAHLEYLEKKGKAVKKGYRYFTI